MSLGDWGWVCRVYRLNSREAALRPLPTHILKRATRCQNYHYQDHDMGNCLINLFYLRSLLFIWKVIRSRELEWNWLTYESTPSAAFRHGVWSAQINPSFIFPCPRTSKLSSQGLTDVSMKIQLQKLTIVHYIWPFFHRRFIDQILR